MKDKYFSNWVIKLFVLFFVVIPLITNVIVPGIMQLTKCIGSEISEQYMEFVTDQRIKRNLRESSPEWQEKTLASINLFKQRIEGIDRIFQRTKDPFLRHEYLELVRYHNNLVERFQQAKFRFQIDPDKILPQKIVIF